MTLVVPVTVAVRGGAGGGGGLARPASPLRMKRAGRAVVRERPWGARGASARGGTRVADVRRYRLDDLRRFAAALAAGLGIAPARASALATHLLWFDAAGAAPLGVATLTDVLEQLDS